MPNTPLSIGRTNPKTGTLQFSEHRIQGLTLLIPAESGVSSVPNNRIVSIQEDSDGNRYAVTYPAAITYNYETLKVIGFGVLEAALQSGGIDSISPTPNTFVDGDQVVVLRNVAETYMIDYDPSNVPTVGIASARVDEQGRLTSRSATTGVIQLQGAVFKSVPGLQMTGQLKTNTLFYQMRDAVTP